MHDQVMKQSQSFQSRKVGIVDVKLGVGTTIVEPSNLYGCTIGDRSFIGPFVEIQSAAHIGKDCRIQSHSFICSKVKIGDHCFIGHGVTFTNDLFKDGLPSSDAKDWLPTIIEERVSIGSGSTILPVHIVAGCVIGAGSVITKDLNVKGVYAGNPARLLRKL
jgi:acetyltransferase-like isoleucine patch superfamily enzyme